MPVPIADAAAQLDKSPEAVRRAILRGELAGYMVGRKWFLPDDWEDRAVQSKGGEAPDVGRGQRLPAVERRRVDAVAFLRDRLHFIRADGRQDRAPFASVLMGFGEECAEAVMRADVGWSVAA